MEYNTYKNRLTSIYERRKKLHINDPQVYKYWDEITELMASDEEQTIRLLRVLNEVPGKLITVLAMKGHY
jgi:ACT domain-containing protein